MIIEALVNYANTYLTDPRDLYMQNKPVKYIIEIDIEGNYITHILNKSDIESKWIRLNNEWIFKSYWPRNSSKEDKSVGIGCDSSKYILFENVEYSIRTHEEFYNITKLDIIRAICLFYEKNEHIRVKSILYPTIDFDIATSKELPSDNIAFSVKVEGADPVLVVRDEIVRNKYGEYYNTKRNSKAEEPDPHFSCSICGCNKPYFLTYDKINGGSIPKANSTGCSLISYNGDSFCSYGKESCSNAQMCMDCSNKFTLALNDLLQRGTKAGGVLESYKHKTMFREDTAKCTLVYWTKEPISLDIEELLFQPDIEIIHRLLTEYRTGKRTYSESTNMFYMVSLKGNAGRVYINNWIETTVAEIQSNLHKWFTDQDIYNTTYNSSNREKYPGLKDIFAMTCPSIVVKKGKLEKIEPLLKKTDPAIINNLILRALQGKPLGIKTLNSLIYRLTRNRASPITEEKNSHRKDINRIGILRMCLNDTLRLKGEQDMGLMLDENDKNKSYLCGRLLAVCERIQKKAHDKGKGPDLRATISDTMFTSFCTRPNSAFSKVVSLTRIHITKLRRAEDKGISIYFEKQMTSIIANMDGFLPSIATTVDQARFIIGYYQQIQANYTSKETNNG